MLNGNSAVAVARDVALRIADPALVRAAVEAAARQTACPLTAHWDPSSVAQGDAGLAILCAYLDACFPEEGWDEVGHDFLASAARAAERSDHLPVGLFGGLSGLAFAAWLSSRRGRRYRRLLETLDSVILSRAQERARALSADRHGVSVAEFDTITGLSGVGRYLLCRLDAPETPGAVRTVLQGLVSLVDHREGIPRWYTPPHLLADDTIRRIYPEGNLNCGLAHGIPGPLALMSVALRLGFAVPGLEDAVDRICEWLVRSRSDDSWGVNWPTAIPVRGDGQPEGDNLDSSRAAWCYGSPGVARALWLAGQARGDSDLCSLAEEAMEAVYRRPVPERRIDSPTFCHGIAGLLAITLRFARDTGAAVHAEAAAALTEQVLTLHEPDSLLGYRNLEPGGRRIDQPGLLEGAPGVALALLSAATDVEPEWDALFLLS